MKCPSCQHPSTQVLETRLQPEGQSLKRRRKCENPECGFRFVTYERPHISLPMILKRDGRREDYHSEKLSKAIQIAARKRPISAEQIDALVERIEQKLFTSLEKEIQSTELGTWVMAELVKLDPVAYIRFASVYQNIQNLEEFSLLIHPFIDLNNQTEAQIQNQSQNQGKLMSHSNIYTMRPIQSNATLKSNLESDLESKNYKNYEYPAIQKIKHLELEGFQNVAGVWQIPGSKSLSNRLLLLLALAQSQANHSKSISQVLDSEDIDYMLKTLQTLNMQVIKTNDQTHCYQIQGDLITALYQSYQNHQIHQIHQIHQSENLATDLSLDLNFDLFVGNAGTVMRPMVAVLSILASLFKNISIDLRFKLHGIARMHERPLAGLIDALRSIGCRIECLENEGFAPLIIQGSDQFLQQLSENTNEPNMIQIQIDGSQSSQFISSLLMALPLFSHFSLWLDQYLQSQLNEDSKAKNIENIENIENIQNIKNLLQKLEKIKVQIIGEKISQPYIDMTIYCMRDLGVEILKKNNGYEYKMGQTYHSDSELVTEGDASTASYPIAAALIAATDEGLLIKGIRQDSIQGDIAFIQAVQTMGAQIEWQAMDELRVFKSELKAATINCLNIPDAAMTLAILAFFAKGTTRLTHIHSWKLKETDRIIAIATELQKLGAKVIYDEDSIEITPPSDDFLLSENFKSKNIHIHTYNDHRMAMCFSLIAFTKTKGLVIDEPECVIKTYPNYFADLFKVL